MKNLLGKLERVPLRKAWSREALEFTPWLQANGSTLKTQKPLPQHWTNIALGRAGIHLAATVNSRENRVGMEVYIDHDNSKAMFKQLQAHQADIHKALNAELEWMALPDGHACRILQVRANSPLEVQDQWPVYFAWLEDVALRMSTVFRPLVKELN